LRVHGPDRDLRGTPKQQQIGLNYIKKLIDQMVLLDSPSLIGPVYSATGRADAVPRGEYKKQWKTVVKHLKTASKYAQERGKQICLEPLNRFETDFIIPATKPSKWSMMSAAQPLKFSSIPST
jgi:D-psicose/D-tagatose/L-ribulose 3-epimerase